MDELLVIVELLLRSAQASSLGPDVCSVVQLGFSKMWSTFWSSFLRSGKECCSQLQCWHWWKTLKHVVARYFDFQSCKSHSLLMYLSWHLQMLLCSVLSIWLSVACFGFEDLEYWVWHKMVSDRFWKCIEFLIWISCSFVAGRRFRSGIGRGQWDSGHVTYGRQQVLHPLMI